MTITRKQVELVLAVEGARGPPEIQMEPFEKAVKDVSFNTRNSFRIKYL